MSEASNFIKTEEAKVVEENLKDPLEIIKAAAEGIGLILNDPKPNCKHCHGRGYIGLRVGTGEPIPCNCILPKYESQRPANDVILPQNRAQRRAALKKMSNKQAAAFLKASE